MTSGTGSIFSFPFRGYCAERLGQLEGHLPGAFPALSRAATMIPGRHAALLLSLLAAVACSPRERLSQPYPTRLPADQRVEVWRAGTRLILSHVTVDSAGVHGAAAPWRPRCDSCRVSVPRAEVDSLVLLNGTTTEAVAILGTTAVLGLVWVLNDCKPFFPRCS